MYFFTFIIRQLTHSQLTNSFLEDDPFPRSHFWRMKSFLNKIRSYCKERKKSDKNSVSKKALDWLDVFLSFAKGSPHNQLKTFATAIMEMIGTVVLLTFHTLQGWQVQIISADRAGILVVLELISQLSYFSYFKFCYNTFQIFEFRL